MLNVSYYLTLVINVIWKLVPLYFLLHRGTSLHHAEHSRPSWHATRSATATGRNLLILSAVLATTTEQSR